jgi:hypothetical protein
MISLPKPKPKASGTAGCEKIVGIKKLNRKTFNPLLPDR